MPSHSPDDRPGSTTRRNLLAAGAGLAITGLAGCLGDSGASDTDDSGEPWGDALESSAVSWDDLGDLEGDLTVYSGRKRSQIDPLFQQLEEAYPDLTINRDYDDNARQLNKLREEGDASPADVFYTQSSGALANLKQDDLLRDLPADIVEAVPADKSDPDGTWTGASGRVRAVQFNTETFEAVDLPTDIFEYAEDERFQGIISTRPNSGTFQSFIVAMLELEGEQATREWVRAMVDDQDATLYSSGSAQAEAIEAGENQVGLGNQYYAARILNNDPEANLGVTFTENDPGTLFNVSGVGIPESTGKFGLAAEFTRHVLAAEGQEFFVDVNGEYPVVEGVEYVGAMPPLSDLETPDFDLNALADVERAVDLLREEGMTV
ncbi:MAG: extracellular solute-binding protein [Halobacteriota archaeon]